MKNNIEHNLNTTRPSLSHEEQQLLWSTIEPHLTPRSIPSPYMHLVKDHVRLSAALFILTIVLIGGGASVQADEARPGDILFPLDRALERVALSLTPSAEKRSAVGNRQSEERITELREMIQDSQKQNSDFLKTHTTVGSGVGALINVMEQSNMSQTARERIYEKLFIEIDPLSVDVRIEESASKKSDRIKVSGDSEGVTKIEIHEQSKQTRIERKGGVVKVEYNEGEVRGEKTSKGDDEKGNEEKGKGDDKGRGN